ncbi:phytanoyl-CoA dioxygenase family protein [Sphingomonas glaciei]|uniref:phytanoyl-CoA dioxygenase family protein n=1 Tax=Sphingomonas glaciei TaxID=2938948 RepID=UPI0029E8047D|nr:phytanoyl-CoA dioxygenase family protein [Sphingomonas glaciei]
MPANNPLPGVPLVESPLFRSMLDDLGLSPEERRIATDLHERGYAVIDFPDPAIGERVDRIKKRLAPRFGIDPNDTSTRLETGGLQRVQDAWREDEDVRAIATNPAVLSLLERLYGRPAIPFQTLNFPIGTEQKLHSDSNHFSSIPERFMCGIWLAMEDVHADAGPLTYAPASHKWPIVSNLMIGRRGTGGALQSAQDPFEDVWNAMLAASGSQQEVLLIRKGQAMIWAANLLHGGSVQTDHSRTRWSQVTHYYFEDCIYYTPAFSDEALGDLAVRSIFNIAADRPQPNLYLGEVLKAKDDGARDEAGTGRRRFPWQRKPRPAGRLQPQAELPGDFDAAAYLRLNPDVAEAGMDPAEHYRTFGYREARPYRQG